jgi:hypothetical protein
MRSFTKMRRNAFRALVVAGAVMALSVPVLTAPNTASACSQPGGLCTVTITGSSTWDTFISPLTATIGTAVFTEFQTARQLPLTASVTIPGSLGFTVFDLRGNNQGFVAFLSCTFGAACMTSSLSPSNNGAQISASQFAIGGLASVQTLQLFGDSVGLGVAIPSTGGTLDMQQPVAGECPREEIGQGIYNVTVPLSMTLSGLQVEFLTLPVSWFGNFNLTIVEGTGPGSAGTPPATSVPACPPFSGP